MKIALIGSTAKLIELGKKLVSLGYKIPLVFSYTCKLPYFETTDSEVKDFANSVGADYFNDIKINHPSNVETIKSYQCDLGVSISWINIIKKDVIDSLKLGILNAHAGDLPRYRGNACQTWAILNRESKIASSIHWMDDGLDSGDIISKRFLNINDDTYIGDIFDWLSDNLVDQYLEAINKVRLNPRARTVQSSNKKDILRCFPRKKEDGRINWFDSSVKIRTLIRATSKPYPGAFCFFENRELIVWRADYHTLDYNYLSIPGQLITFKNGNPLVVCGDGVLELTHIQIDKMSHLDTTKLILSSMRNRLT